MQIVGYMILLVFYLCYFIKMFQQRKQGIQTDHMGKGKQGIQKKIEIMMKGATIATFIIEILSIYLNTTTFPLIIRIMGIFLGIIGDIIFIVSVLTMKESWRAGVSYEEKTDLITDGIYQISRNPAFLGFDLVYVGIGFMFFNAYLGVISFLAIIMFHLQIKYVEEPFLKQEFKDDYLHYYQKVNRYLGKKTSL
ncbi:MAG TPA: isoprenylcysteine carboxylmethyltransferase family protein [Coprobacillaceae bacterium]|nr:isoprenylcysteine carboxylmethyltransferase family protein [Coprobacillaceae bacterium]